MDTRGENAFRETRDCALIVTHVSADHGEFIASNSVIAESNCRETAARSLGDAHARG